MTWLENEESRLIDQVPPWIRATGRISLRLSLIALFLLVMVAVYYWIAAARFDLEKVTTMPERSLLLDRDGDELAAIHGARRRMVQYEDLPPHLVQALMTREDKQFREHGGVHLRGVARATMRNLKDWQMTQGASTLTMQLARNTYELRANSLNRKFLEAALAFRLEANFSKDEILAAYLNRIYFGSGAYGIQQASRSYFGKETKELTVPEAALLVGIIRAPHAFSPRNDRAAALRERNDVLSNMVSDSYLQPSDGERFQETELHLMPPTESKTDAIRCVRRHLNELLDRADFAAGGLTATSTIDSSLQQAAREGLDLILADYPSLQTALVVIDSATGAIEATITARDPASSQFNRAFDTRRQLGPAFRPFIYAFSAERGRLPIPGQPIQTARQLPEGELARLAERLGFKGPFPKSDELARGNFQATPLETARALTSLGNLGNAPTTFLISELRGADGSSLFQQEIATRPVLDPFAAQTPFDIAPERTWSDPNIPSTDLWTLHTSEALSIALWIGYDQPEPLTAPDRLAADAKALVETLVRIKSHQENK